jgi:hypothetical protein
MCLGFLKKSFQEGHFHRFWWELNVLVSIRTAILATVIILACDWKKKSGCPRESRKVHISHMPDTCWGLCEGLLSLAGAVMSYARPVSVSWFHGRRKVSSNFSANIVLNKVFVLLVPWLPKRYTCILRAVGQGLTGLVWGYWSPTFTPVCVIACGVMNLVAKEQLLCLVLPLTGCHEASYLVSWRLSFPFVKCS